MSRELSPDALRRLELARAAWRADAPSASEVERAVRRVARVQPRRRHAAAAPAVAGAVIALAALAFAAQRRGAHSALDPPPATHAPAAILSAATKPSVVRAGPPAMQSPTPAPTVLRSPAPVPAVRKERAHVPRTSWRGVDHALERGDAAAATRLLERLAREPDARTRAKAELGLAQLAAASGNCARAARLAERVKRVGDAELADHARAVLQSCAAR